MGDRFKPIRDGIPLCPPLFGGVSGLFLGFILLLFSFFILFFVFRIVDVVGLLSASLMAPGWVHMFVYFSACCGVLLIGAAGLVSIIIYLLSRWRYSFTLALAYFLDFANQALHGVWPPLLFFASIYASAYAHGYWRAGLAALYLLGIAYGLHVFKRRPSFDYELAERRREECLRAFLASGDCWWGAVYSGIGCEAMRVRSGDARKACLWAGFSIVWLSLSAMACSLEAMLTGRVSGFLFSTMVLSLAALLVSSYYDVRVPLHIWMGRLRLAWEGKLKLIQPAFLDDPVSAIYRLSAREEAGGRAFIISFLGIILIFVGAKETFLAPLVVGGFAMLLLGLATYRRGDVGSEALEILSGKRITAAPLVRPEDLSILRGPYMAARPLIAKLIRGERTFTIEDYAEEQGISPKTATLQILHDLRLGYIKIERIEAV